MATIPNRMVIYAKDIQNITGRSERAACKLLARIRQAYSKTRGAFVSVEEFCTYTGLRPEHVVLFLV